MKKIKDLLFGHIPEKDARIIYTLISSDLNNLRDGLLIGYWSDEPYKTSKIFENLKIKNLDKLLPDYLRIKLENFFDKKKKFIELKSKCDEEIYRLFKGFYISGSYDEDEGLVSSTYEIILKENYKFEDFPKDIFKFDFNKFNEINNEIKKNEKVQDFLKFLKTTLEELNKLNEKLIESYKYTISFPENRRNVLTILNIVIAVFLVGATIWTAWTSQQLIKEQFQKESETFIPNSAELKIKAIGGIFINKADLFSGNHKLILLVENRGRLSSGKVILSLGTKLMFNKHPYPIDDINETGKVKIRIPLIPDCFGNKGCDENSTNLSFGIQEVPLYVHCDSCEPQDYYERIGICIYSENLDICQVEI